MRIGATVAESNAYGGPGFHQREFLRQLELGKVAVDQGLLFGALAGWPLLGF
jgi:hypothetical protein